MPRYARNKIDEVARAVDLAELVSRYVILKKAGADYSGLCPFHAEKTPSFTVSPHRNFFYCFGCGAGGGPIDFLMRIESLSFPEALAELARRYGVELPAADDAGPSDGVNRPALYEALEQAQKFYAARLWSAEGAVARRYLAEERGLAPPLIRAFGLGLAPDRWDGLSSRLKALGFSEQTALQAGLIKAGREKNRFYDFFRRRLMIPIADSQGRTVAFGGRLLPGDEGGIGKYINTGATPLYTKGQLLFGHRRARPFIRAEGLAYLVEGYFDLISLVSVGLNPVVAALGTALTERQIGLLKGLTGRVYLFFDDDEAGQAAIARNLPALLNAELEARAIRPPPDPGGGKHDPDSFVRKFGAEALQNLAAGAESVLEFWAARLKRQTPAEGGVDARFRRLRQARELSLQVTDPGKRRIVNQELAGLLELDEDALFGAERPVAARPGRILGRPAAEPGRTAAAPAADPTALALLEFVMIHPETAGLVLAGRADYWPQDASRLWFERLKAAWAAGDDLIAAAAAWGDLPEGLPARIAKAALTPRPFEPGQAEAPARDYLARLRGKWRRGRQAELTAAIARAQAAGDEPEIRRLQAEKKDLLAPDNMIE